MSTLDIISGVRRLRERIGVEWPAGARETADAQNLLQSVAAELMLSAARDARNGEGHIDGGWQAQVHDWMIACFGEAISRDGIERNHRFLEEALELVQACGCTAAEAHKLVDYVFGRPVGETAQEIGGVMVTLAALCNVHQLNMDAAGAYELERCWSAIDKIRAKHAAKPKHSPLPGPSAPALAQQSEARVREALDFDAWLAALEEDVVQGEYGYEPGEFTVFPEDWRQAWDDGLTPSAAFRRACEATTEARKAEDALKAADALRIKAEDRAAIAEAALASPAPSRVEPVDIQKIADAIAAADDRCGFNMQLTRLVDGESTYTLTMLGETREFSNTDDLYEVVRQNKDRERAKAILAAFAVPEIPEAEVPDLLERHSLGERLTATQAAVVTGYGLGWRDGYNDGRGDQTTLPHNKEGEADGR